MIQKAQEGDKPTYWEVYKWHLKTKRKNEPSSLRIKGYSFMTSPLVIVIVILILLVRKPLI